MSINQATGTNVFNNKRNIPPVYNIPQTKTLTPYVRPSDWLTMPTVLSSEQKIVLLVAITNDDSNYIGLTATTDTGTFTVDWGDGTSPVTFVSGSTVSKLLDFNSYPSNTLTSRGYRQALITITPTTANLTTFNLNVKPTLTTGTFPSTTINKVLEIVVAGTNLTSVILGGSNQQSTWMEQANIVSLASNVNMTSLFNGCISLRNIINIPNTNTTNTSTMFSGCFNLQTVPLFNTSSVTIMASMFSNCYNLIEVPPFDTSSATDINSMFAVCSSLSTAPFLNTINVTNMAGMFQSCYSLTSVPFYDTRNATSMNGMFQNCYSLKTVPTFNTIKVIDLSNMFNNCRSLTKVPVFNFAACTNSSRMFQLCYSLTSVPLLNLPVVQNMNQMFLSCFNVIAYGGFITSSSLNSLVQTFNNNHALINGPTITNTTNVNSINELFYNCYSLQSVPLYNLGNCLVFTAAFAFCYSLTNIPNFDTSKATNTNIMFQASGLVNAPTLNTSNVTDMSLMFYQSQSLLSIPLYDTSKVTNMNGMLQETVSLGSVPAFNTANVTNMQAFLQGSGVKYFDANLNTSKVTNFVNFALNTRNLVNIPQFNLSNVTNAGSAFQNSFGLSKVDISNLKVTTSFISCNLSKTALESIMTNLGSNNTSQTLSISTNPGVDTALSKTCTWTSTSNVVTMTNTVGVPVGAILSNATNMQSGYAFTAANNKISVNSLMDSNTLISFNSVTSSNLLPNVYYYTSNVSGSGPYEYDISTTVGGAPLTFTSGSMTGRINLQVKTVNTNANVILNAYPAGSGTSVAITTRILNTNLAAFKGWTVSG